MSRKGVSPTFVVAIIGLTTTLLAGYLGSLYSDAQTIKNWKREAFGTIVGEVMYLDPDHLLLPEISDDDACAAYFNRRYSTARFDSEQVKKIEIVREKLDRAFGVSILLAGPRLRKTLIEFKKTVDFATSWQTALLKGDVKGIKIRPLKMSDERPDLDSAMGDVIKNTQQPLQTFCGYGVLKVLGGRRRIQEELLSSMRRELGLE